MDAVMLGHIVVIALWVVILVPTIRGLVHFFRTTRLADLVPRVTRVRVVR